MDLVVGSTRPAFGDPSHDATGRHWPATVHAVEHDDGTEPYRARCGAIVLFRYPDDPWPPGTREDWCPACVRLTHPIGWVSG